MLRNYNIIYKVTKLIPKTAAAAKKIINNNLLEITNTATGTNRSNQAKGEITSLVH
jgi:hypothetical protein